MTARKTSALCRLSAKADALVRSARLIRPLFMLAPLALSGCVTAQISPEEAPFGGGQVNPAGANGLLRFASPTIPAAELAAQICPARRVNYASWPSTGDPLSDALACFSEEGSNGGASSALLARRNAVLGYLMLRSDQACALWVTYIERAGAVNRGMFNVTSVITGGVGALVTGTASRIFSGASGIASGTGAAIDSAMFHGLTEGLILPRVAEARAARRAAILAKLGQDVATYPMSVSIADALDYHGSCNVGSALRQDTPAATFGQQLDYLVQNASRVVAAKAALSGAREPALTDVQAGAVFMTRSGDVLRVDSIPAAGAAGQTVTYSLVGPKTQKSAVDPSAFLTLVRGGLVLGTP